MTTGIIFGKLYKEGWYEVEAALIVFLSVSVKLILEYYYKRFKQPAQRAKDQAIYEEKPA